MRQSILAGILCQVTDEMRGCRSRSAVAHDKDLAAVQTNIVVFRLVERTGVRAQLGPPDVELPIGGERGTLAPVTRGRDAVEKVDPARHAQLRTAYGFDEPVIVQYGIYIGRVLQGDLGKSLITQDSVMSEFLAAPGTSQRRCATRRARMYR